MQHSSTTYGGQCIGRGGGPARRRDVNHHQMTADSAPCRGATRTRETYDLPLPAACFLAPRASLARRTARLRCPSSDKSRRSTPESSENARARVVDLRRGRLSEDRRLEEQASLLEKGSVPSLWGCCCRSQHCRSRVATGALPSATSSLLGKQTLRKGVCRRGTGCEAWGRLPRSQIHMGREQKARRKLDT
jgi:hypothetical protein